MIKSKKQMYLVIGAFALVLMLFTTTYAFFNYTRTGSANTIRTGRIAFNSTQGQAINLTNVFPIDVTNGIPNNNANVGSVTINVTGDTTYTDGVEYLVSAVNVQNTIGSGANAKTLPISIDVSVASNTHGEEPNQTTTILGTADADYFTHRGPSVNSSIYKVLAENTISDNDNLLVGYIKSGATGVDGNIVIRAYLDASKVAISDTYPEETVHTVKTTGYSSSNCETTLTGVQDASTYCATSADLQDAIDNEDLTSAQITLLVNAGIVEEYTNGTPASFGTNKEVFTTNEWNSLQTNGVSFQIKVESNEGIWVDAPAIPIVPTIDSCPGCKFVFPSSSHTFYHYALSYDPVLDEDVPASTISDIVANGDTLYDNYTLLNKDYFLGLKFNESTNVLEKAYACGIKDYGTNHEIPFCLEGVGGDDYGGNETVRANVYNSNSTLLNDSTTGLWLGECEVVSANGWTLTSCYDIDNHLTAAATTYGAVYVNVNSNQCDVSEYGIAYC